MVHLITIHSLLDVHRKLCFKHKFSWFQSYLLDGKHFVELNYVNNFNQLTNFSCGLRNNVPGGCILGPLLFVL